MIGQAWYLITIMLFGGSAVAFSLILLHKELRKYFRLMAILVLISLALTPVMEPPALAVRAWVYRVQYMLDMHFLGAELETYLFTAMVGIAIGAFTLVFADVEDKGISFRKFTRKKIEEVFKTGS